MRKRRHLMAAGDETGHRDDLPVVERRKRKRRPGRPDDWESVALGRVARRVEVLTDARDCAELATGENTGYGWEQRALDNLRRRLKPRDGG